MGTNFYYTDYSTECPHCEQRAKEDIHIGKSSAGWAFLLRVYPDRGINSLEDWKEELASSEVEITNEYGDSVSLDALLKCITERIYDGPPPMGGGFVLRPGLSVLFPVVDGERVVGHGEGTWALVNSEFS